MTDFLNERLEGLRARGLERRLPGTRTGIDFWSNDYLGFGRSNMGARTQLMGEGGRQSELVRGEVDYKPGSRLISGDADYFQQVEARIAAHHGAQSALVFASGYLANLGLLSCLATRHDAFYYDALVHASAHDGMRLSPAPRKSFAHNNPEALRDLLAKPGPPGQRFVLTEARFSMDGDLAPLANLQSVCAEHAAHLIVDEAHTFGLESEYRASFARIVTYGKAGGFHGAAVLGSPGLRAYLIARCRPFIFSTGVRPEQYAGIAALYDRLESEGPAARERLRQLIDYFNRRVNAAGLRDYVPGNAGPIQVVSIPDNTTVMRTETQLAAAGYLVKGIRSPTVPPGRERLRVCLHAFNTEAEVDGLLAQLTQALPPCP